MAGTTWKVFAPNTKIRSAEMNDNFDWMEGNLVPMNAGSSTDGAYDLGTSAQRWANAYLYDCNILSGLQFGTSAVSSPYRIVYDSSTIQHFVNAIPTYIARTASHTFNIQSGTSYQVAAKFDLSGTVFYAGGAEILRADTTGVYLPATKKLYLDGGGDTYITEAATNTISLIAGGSECANGNSSQRWYVFGECSALSFTDRTPYPKTLSEAYEAVNSMELNNDETGVAHEKLSPFIKIITTKNKVKKNVADKIECEKDNNGNIVQDVELGRNLSATVSAQNEVIKDLIKRITRLEAEG